MRQALVSVMLLALAGCGKGSFHEAADDGGRYSGVGIYGADDLWRHVRGAPAAGETRAKLADDSQIIVVVDRNTGEIRQCGNRSGYCIAMNPWTRAAPGLPVELDAHADDLGGVYTNNAAEPEPEPAG